jgi:hypothetical protein
MCVRLHDGGGQSVGNCKQQQQQHHHHRRRRRCHHHHHNQSTSADRSGEWCALEQILVVEECALEQILVVEGALELPDIPPRKSPFMPTSLAI